MNNKLKMAVTAVAMAFALGSGSGAFAKAHDQGVADGNSTPDNTGAFVQSLSGPGATAAIQDRGANASAVKGGNRVVPVVGNGNNAEPD